MSLNPATVPVVLLCGGEGTRFRESTKTLPKPLTDIGGQPILWHLMRSFASQGFKRFILCLGYKGDLIKRYFLEYSTRTRSFLLRLDTGEKVLLDDAPVPDWRITFADTGPTTQTGARVSRIRQFVDTEHMIVTYSDGVADIDLRALLEFHIEQGTIGTVTGIHSKSQFGELKVDGDRVTSFAEKPEVPSLINGGFFVFRRKFFDYLSSDEGCILEREPMEKLVRDGQLSVYRHDGFWQCLDTFKDAQYLDGLCAEGTPPWERSG